MRIFMVIVKAVCGECHTYFFNNIDDANKFAFEKWIGLCEEERLDTLISVYWIDLSSLFNNFDDRRCEKLDVGMDDKCFSSRQIVKTAQNAYHEYPSMFFAALDDLATFVSGDTGQLLKEQCTEAALRLGDVYLKALDAAGIPLWLIEKN